MWDVDLTVLVWDIFTRSNAIGGFPVFDELLGVLSGRGSFLPTLEILRVSKNFEDERLPLGSICTRDFPLLRTWTKETPKGLRESVHTFFRLAPSDQEDTPKNPSRWWFVVKYPDGDDMSSQSKECAWGMVIWPWKSRGSARPFSLTKGHILWSH